MLYFIVFSVLVCVVLLFCIVFPCSIALHYIVLCCFVLHDSAASAKACKYVLLPDGISFQYSNEFTAPLNVGCLHSVVEKQPSIPKNRGSVMMMVVMVMTTPPTLIIIIHRIGSPPLSSLSSHRPGLYYHFSI